MKDFLRLLLYVGKEVLRDWSFTFWTVLYPILMAVFFFAAFNGIDEITFENVPVAVVQGSMTETLISQVPVFEVTAVESEEVGTQLVLDKKVDGFITNSFNVEFSEGGGTSQTIIRNVTNQMKRGQTLGLQALDLDYSKQYVQASDQKASMSSVLFYSLLASMCFSAVYMSIAIATETQPNLSTIGARLAVSPIKKSYRIMANFVISLGLNVLSNFLLVAFIYYVLKIQLFHTLGLSLILLFFANFCATLLGFAASYSNTWPSERKSGVAQGILLTLSALAGMMGPFIRNFVDQHVPIINKINPIAVLTNELYRVNMLNDTSSFLTSIGILGIFGILSGLVAYYFLRGETYDSI